MENKKLIEVTKLHEDVEYIAVGMKETGDGVRMHTEGACTGANMLEAIEEICVNFLEQDYFPAPIAESILCAAVDKAINKVHGHAPISSAMAEAMKSKFGIDPKDEDDPLDLLRDIFGGKKKAEKKPEKKAEPEKVVEKVEENVEKPEAIRVTIERVKGGKKG